MRIIPAMGSKTTNHIASGKKKRKLKDAGCIFFTNGKAKSKKGFGGRIAATQNFLEPKNKVSKRTSKIQKWGGGKIL